MRTGCEVMNRIVLASGNKGKLKELEKILHHKEVKFIPQGELNVSDADETGLSFVENAIIKARHACEITHLPAVSDDSGIEVDFLKGRPGIYSARYAGLDSNDERNNQRLLDAMKDVSEPQRTARFQCVIVYMRYATDPMPLICQGTWEGRILYEVTGENGFGYDFIFHVPTHNCASSELQPAIKNQLSHRGQALRKLLQCWKDTRL